jgi:signal transduction histidine kinase
VRIRAVGSERGVGVGVTAPSELESEVRARLGHFPALFSVAAAPVRLSRALWRFCEAHDLDSPLPDVCRARLFAYLSRFCPVPYPLVVRSCALRALGITAQQVLALLSEPPPLASLRLRPSLEEARRLARPLTAWPADRSPADVALRSLAIHLALAGPELEHCRSELARLFPPELYGALVMFLAVVRTTHQWCEAFPEVRYEDDPVAAEHLGPMLLEEPRLASLLGAHARRAPGSGPEGPAGGLRPPSGERQGGALPVVGPEAAVREPGGVVLRGEASASQEPAPAAQDSAAAAGAIAPTALETELFGRLAGGLAHEINNPLQIVIGFADLALACRGPGADLEAYLTKIREAADRCTRVVRSVLLFARDYETNEVMANLNNLVEDAVRALEPQLASSGVRAVLSLDPTVPSMLLDVPRIRQVLAQVMGNARDAMTDAGRPGEIRVRTTHREGAGGVREVVVAVEDEGPGVAANVEGRILYPFVTTKSPGRGSGLGLSLAAGIVGRHRGRIEIVNSPGKGACFEVILPVRTAAGPPESDRPSPVISS